MKPHSSEGSLDGADRSEAAVFLCPNCGEVVSDSVRFCTSCGGPVPANRTSGGNDDPPAGSGEQAKSDKVGALWSGVILLVAALVGGGIGFLVSPEGLDIAGLG